MAMQQKEKATNELLSRNVEKIINKKHLDELLSSGKKLRIKHGIDPTGPKIHLGRAISLWKLKVFQELGHKIVLIIGNFTAQIGDASDKQSQRKSLSEAEIKDNMKGYTEQIGKIIDIEKAEIRHNSEWLEGLSIKEFLNIAKHFTAQQVIQRRNFHERWNKADPIGLHEIIYPLLQGYDSVAVKADVEIGGFDQLFNLDMGRRTQKLFNQKPQDIMLLTMLSGLDGRKMSTSWGNVINIMDSPKEMFGKIMSMKDELVSDYLKSATNIPLEKIDNLIKREINPRDTKVFLAREIVTLYHGKEESTKAEKEFEMIFQERKVPDKIPSFKLKGKINIVDLLIKVELSSSKSEAKRLVLQRGVKIDSKVQENWHREISVKEGMIIQVGKRRFVKIKS
jgi:tyrosyl-tRNA synthetase